MPNRRQTVRDSIALYHPGLPYDRLPPSLKNNVDELISAIEHRLPEKKDFKVLSVETGEDVVATVKGKTVEEYNAEHYYFPLGYNEAIQDFKEILKGE